MTRILSILFLLLAVPALAANWYVRPNGGTYGAENGTNWVNAFDGFADIAWGSVNAGDTIYVGTGSYSGGTIGESGTTNNPITIRAAQDTHVGVATFTANLNVYQDFITVDGEYNGSRNFKFDGCSIDGYGADYPHIRFVEAFGADIGIALSGDVNALGGIIDNCSIYDIRETAGIRLVGRNYYNSGYDKVHIRNSIIQVNSQSQSVNADGGYQGSGDGPDGIMGCWGLTISNCLIYGAVGTVVASGEHQDGVQMQAGYVKILNCTFKNLADAAVGCDTDGGGPALNHIHSGNLFYLRRGGGIRYYGNNNAYTMNNVYILNNTFVDHTSYQQWALSISATHDEVTSASNVYVQNNIFKNCLGSDGEGKAMQIFAQSGVSAAVFNVDYNWHDQPFTVDGNGSYLQTHDFSSPITFVGYTSNSITSDMRLASNDTGAKDLGADWSSIFALDHDFVSRPQGSAWDIGAYENSGGVASGSASSEYTGLPIKTGDNLRNN